MSVGDLFAEPDGATPLSPEDFGGLIPTWIATRAADLAPTGDARRSYLAALRRADAAGDFGPLVTFARS